LIDVHRLAVLQEVARAGSFAGAAAALHHTPSAVSQQIAALERGTGVVLVERSTRGVILTDAGRTLLATADAIHAELQLAAQRLRALAADGPQALTVVTFPSAGEPLLAPSLTAMTAAADNPVEITVIEAEPDEALGAVRDGRADLSLVYHFHTAAPPRGWPAIAGTGTYVPLVDDPLRLLVPAGHPLAGRPAASLAEVAGERWIHGWGDVGDVTDMLAALSGFRPQVACRSSDYRFMSALVGAGVGVALVPSLALTGSPEVRALQITPQLIRYIGAWLPRRHQPNPAAEQLLAALRVRAPAKPMTQGLAAVSRGRMPRPLGLDNCRSPGGMRRRGGVRLYGGRKGFRFRAADRAAERDGGSWLRPATRSAKESRSTRAWPIPPGCMTTGSAGRTTSPPTGRPRSR